ncbi:murein hydrolase activator EnvC family protein [Sporosarcina highlanderae]|uniref:Peptidoglycan DD-metalloendopeptidase family protein n=1 Tax=Sporosarcina highlanderae TaxID=3035916 RepID=A0ABT8JNX1_9BACL|nr:peptidoglycan DD-metalloendopeptidase family protein [Sporosarcina highlanderae]MDN4606836.1 peptidoglycan DD-metalloendopeptidase family protein [Sporosarcina highlanderae]
MKRRWFLISIIAVFMLTSFVGENGVLASKLNELKKEQKQNEIKKNDLKSDIQKKESAIKALETKIDDFLKQILSLNKEIEQTNANMNRVIDSINKTNDEIDALKESIADLEKKIEERDVVLRERVRAMQIKGSHVSYIDVLLGANSFADFIDRFSAVTTLMDADRDIMRKQQQDIDQLETEKALVEKKLAELEESKAKLEKLKASLEAQKKEKSRLIDQLEAEQEKLSQEKKDLEEEYHDTIEVEAELEKAVIAEQKRIAELARKEEERRRKAAAAAAAAKKPGTLPNVSSGFWTRPANGRVSSHFGWRVHPIFKTKRQHRGTDIANSIGTPVVSAADGVVSYAGQMGGYGNVIMVTHSSNGSIFTTVYGHLSKINVSVGQVVDKGTHIGAIGNSGNSTGPHLHFEVHVGNWTASGPSAVNPLRYVSF